MITLSLYLSSFLFHSRFPSYPFPSLFPPYPSPLDYLPTLPLDSLPTLPACRLSSAYIMLASFFMCNFFNFTDKIYINWQN